ncbi:aldehyde dehydrogenase (NAD+)/betaine-aldehyde dehydrogenase [Jatrophihabitans sp. GAS493]|uniref:aldehyde dehydrogenase family protein n=1 Tax=Jatrophihabitans sp. GAS493 TaxID=1907575 RepID=UPI000BB8FC33|nr:aldehyde dehydrogenase family protein [Jatrophihabitans sp. GAS493]SOD71783.1 aldehyde dehydrogenase (NAD+)/betaine-aldehyde dehydrogenase [Jatrophihabitans sp. GAS493]
MSVDLTEKPKEAIDARWDALPLLIGGAFVAGRGEPIVVENPATEQVIARIATADAEQVDAAVGAARQAFTSGPWASMTGRDRRAALHRFADTFEAYADRFAEAIIAELGTPISIAGPLHVVWPIDHLRWYADQAAVDRTEDLGVHSRPVASKSEVAYRPVGVVAAISAYNFPLTLAVHKLGAALAAGCTVVLMPSPRTPISTMLLAQAIAECGLPEGVVNVIAGEAEVARRLTEHPGVDKIAFTGSTAVGTEVMRQAAANLRGVVLELGGKSPAILMPGSDIAAVTPGLHLRYCRNGGQACAAPTRLLVPREDWEEFLAVSRRVYAEIPVGDPLDPATVVGPMISQAHRDRVEGYVNAAIAQGATVVAGGGRPEIAHGWYTNPVLLCDVDNSWPIAQEEVFGPVAIATPYDDLEEAVALANDSRYGLHAYLFSPDLDAARALAGRLRVGAVTINGGGGFRPDAPMGGFGVSGVGREVGKWGILEYLEPQHIQWATG